MRVDEPIERGEKARRERARGAECCSYVTKVKEAAAAAAVVVVVA